MEYLIRIVAVIAFALLSSQSVSGQNSPYRNEIKGYEFYGRHKLARIILGTSTHADVKRVFGDSCVYVCDYDDTWSINFDFVGVNSAAELYNDKLVPRPEFVGKLYSITLEPKKDISFRDIRFPRVFRVSRTFSATSGSESRPGSSSKGRVYKDNWGLIYHLCEWSYPTECAKRDLLAIEYRPSKDLEARMFQ